MVGMAKWGEPEKQYMKGVQNKLQNLKDTGIMSLLLDGQKIEDVQRKLQKSLEQIQMMENMEVVFREQ